ncbi:hypothetical protein B0T24DRAFT_620947 [Lasiosphaeria ovina]|uniref:Secreted protein n=1 Tax=Lasiosphaeria ovina TaxID=92902 RepID=A0AAE0KJ95_9PEZI|nr:hypothetical protein B0T24DRAFT_620947 [Lasiosphaeria ovina]
MKMYSARPSTVVDVFVFLVALFLRLAESLPCSRCFCYCNSRRTSILLALRPLPLLLVGFIHHLPSYYLAHFFIVRQRCYSAPYHRHRTEKTQCITARVLLPRLVSTKVYGIANIKDARP